MTTARYSTNVRVMMNYTVTEIRQKIANAINDYERAEWQRVLVRAERLTRELMDERLGKVDPNWDRKLAAQYRDSATRNGYGYRETRKHHSHGY